MKTLTEIAIEKSRAGVYKDNPENRRLHRVGQRYGDPKKEELASKKPSRTVDENKIKEDLAKVKAMSDEELVSKFLHYDAEKYAKADKAYKKAKSAFQKKWGDGLENIIDKISSIDDAKELLKDSEALGGKLKEAQGNSPYTAKTLQALRRMVSNKLKKGESLDGMNIGAVMVERERSFWKEKDFTAREGEVLASALLRDAASMPAKGDMGDLYWTEADIRKYLHKKLSVKEFNKLVGIVADHQGRQPRQQRGESTIGGYEDFERVMSNLDTEDGQPKEEKKGSGDERFRKIVESSNPDGKEAFHEIEPEAMDDETLSSFIRFTNDNAYNSGLNPKTKENLKKWRTLAEGERRRRKKDAADGSPKSEKAEETFTRVNIPDIPNSGKVNLKKYLSAKRKAAVDEAWSKAGDNLSPERLKQVYDGLVSAFNEKFDSTPKAERAENLYTILKVKNAIEKK